MTDERSAGEQTADRRLIEAEHRVLMMSVCIDNLNVALRRDELYLTQANRRLTSIRRRLARASRQIERLRQQVDG